MLEPQRRPGTVRVDQSHLPQVLVHQPCRHSVLLSLRYLAAENPAHPCSSNLFSDPASARGAPCKPHSGPGLIRINGLFFISHGEEKERRNLQNQDWASASHDRHFSRIEQSPAVSQRHERPRRHPSSTHSWFKRRCRNIFHNRSNTRHSRPRGFRQGSLQPGSMVSWLFHWRKCD